MTSQLAIRLSDEMLEDLDWLVVRMHFANRTEGIRQAVAAAVDRERRREIGERIADGYRHLPPDEGDVAHATPLATASIEDEPWDEW